MKPSRILAFALLLTLPCPGRAAIVATDVTLSIEIEGLTLLEAHSAGSVTVVGSTVFVPAGLISLGAQILAPVTGVSAIRSLYLRQNVSNLAATFRLGGVASQAPSEICPGAGNLSAGVACNVGGGIGGYLALSGDLTFVLERTFPYTRPVKLEEALVGRGGSTNQPFAVDAAVWSTRTGVLSGSGNYQTAIGGAAPISLVTPVFVDHDEDWWPSPSFFIRLTLADVVVPEPSALLLIVAGVAGIAMVARH